MREDPFEQLLREAAEEYHRPPVIPRHEMWLRLQDARAVRQAPRPRRRAFFPLVWAASIAAGVLIGVGLGQLSVVRQIGAPVPAVASDSSAVEEVSGVDADSAADVPSAANPVRPVTAKRAKHTRHHTPNKWNAVSAAYRITMIEHLGQAEVFLTFFRLSVQRGATDPLASATARQLLATNRLLLDSPAGQDQSNRKLLEDLELVLARIAQLSPGSKTQDLKLITTGLERAGVVARLRNEVPAGSRLTAARGAI